MESQQAAFPSVLVKRLANPFRKVIILELMAVFVNIYCISKCHYQISISHFLSKSIGIGSVAKSGISTSLIHCVNKVVFSM